MCAEESVYLPDDGEAGVQVGKATGGQRGAAGGELKEGFSLVRRHPTQNSDEPQEAGTGGGGGGGADNISSRKRFRCVCVCS